MRWFCRDPTSLAHGNVIESIACIAGWLFRAWLAMFSRWLTVSSAYKSLQSIMVSHRAVDQLNSWDSSVNMSLPDSQMQIHRCLDLNCSTVQLLYDTIMDCKDWYTELTAHHLVTRRPPSSALLYNDLPAEFETSLKSKRNEMRAVHPRHDKIIHPYAVTRKI